MYDYSYGYGNDFAVTPDFGSGLAGAGMAVIGGVLAIILIIYIAYLAFALVCYIFRSLGLYSIAKRRGIYSPWLAWIPVGNLWILGSISDQYQYVAKSKVKKRRKVLLGLSIASIVLALPMGITAGVASVMGAMDSSAMLSGMLFVLTVFALGVISILSAVFYYIALYDLYRSCAQSDATLYLVLSILFPVAEPFMVFACRNKDEGMPPRQASTQPGAAEAPVIDADTDEGEATEEDFVEV